MAKIVIFEPSFETGIQHIFFIINDDEMAELKTPDAVRTATRDNFKFHLVHEDVWQNSPMSKAAPTMENPE